MKKRGFTLAEVLITLGIIGVVAALTAPGLVMSSRNEANAAKLSVNVSNLENAFTSMLVKEGTDSLFHTRAWANAGDRNAFAGHLGQYLHINGHRNIGSSEQIEEYYGSADNAPHSMTANGARNSADNRSQDYVQPAVNGAGVGHVIETKNGATLFILPNRNSNPTQAQKENIISRGGALFNEAADVYIDVNGKVGPNTEGRDIFWFYLGDNGILYPMGGDDVAIYDPIREDQNGRQLGTHRWTDAQNGCLDGQIGRGIHCTARLISEGYKMNY